MYEKHFALSELPFRQTPDPRFLWYSDTHLGAKNRILYHIQRSVGPIYLHAPIGTGKTTIARRIVEEITTEKNKKVVLVFAPKLTTTNAFLRFVSSEFAVKTHRSYAQSLREFQAWLIEQYKAGHSPILFVDEAQNMTRDMLLLIQHFFNFSSNKEFLIQIALFAQPELSQKLKRLPSLNSRLSIARINPFTPEETETMMRFRWQVAGGNGFPFSKEAVSEISRISKGIPRTIVKLADQCLIYATVGQQKTVSKEIVQRASSELTEYDE